MRAPTGTIFSRLLLAGSASPTGETEHPFGDVETFVCSSLGSIAEWRHALTSHGDADV